MDPRFIFTVSTGRCGEASLTELVRQHVPTAYPAFEEPQVTPFLPGVLGDAERHLRRRFVERDELLGRGRTLTAFQSGDQAYLESVARRRLRMIRRRLDRTGKTIYWDISKFYARGLFAGFNRVLPTFDLVLLVRDPLENMRSYLNRQKTFLKDNSRPSAPANCLRLDHGDLAEGEMYLGAWVEMYLRCLDLRDGAMVGRSAVIRTSDLSVPSAMSSHFDRLGVPHGEIGVLPPQNTNVASGRPQTHIGPEDRRLFERFRSRLPDWVLTRIPELNDVSTEVA